MNIQDSKFQVSVVVSLLLILASWFIAYSQVTRETEDTLKAQTTSANRLARTFERQTTQIVQYTDSYLRSARRIYQQQYDLNDVVRIMADMALDTSLVSYIAIVDANGIPRHISNSETPMGGSVYERPYFQHFVRSPADELYFSLPHTEPNHETTTIRLVRPLTAADGSFGGVIFAAIEAQNFLTFFETLNLGPENSALLIGLDLKVRARAGNTIPSPNDDMNGSQIWQKLSDKPEDSFLRTHGASGASYHYAYRKLPNLPLIVLVETAGKGLEKQMASFRHYAYGLATAVTLSLIIFLLIFRREILLRNALQASETRFRDVAETSVDWYWETDSEARFSFVSPNIIDVTGIPAESYIGVPLSDIGRGEVISGLSAAQIEELRIHNHTVRERQPFHEFVYKRLLPDGTIKWLSSNGMPKFDDNGTFRGYRGAGRDVTSVVEAEAALRQSEAQMREILENSPLGVSITRRDEAVGNEAGKRIFANIALAEMFGYSSVEELLATEVTETWVNRDDLIRANQILRSEGEVRDFVVRRYRVDGSIIWTSFSARPIQFNGVESTMVWHVDVTERQQAEEALKAAHNELEFQVAERTKELTEEIAERKQIEKALRESEQQLRDFGEAASDWYWEMDANFRITHITGGFTDATGIPAEAVMGLARTATGVFDNLNEEQIRVHQEDLENHRPFRNFIRSRIKDDGTPVWLSINGKPTFDQSGNFIGYRGTGMDITHTYESEQRLLSLSDAIESMPEPVAVFDKDDRFIFTNHAFRDLNRHVSDAIQVGQSFEAFLRAVADLGMPSGAQGRKESWIDERLTLHRTPGAPFELQISQKLWYLTIEKTLENGGNVLLLTNITKLKEAQRDLEAAKETADRANRAKSEFLSSMSHELRTPMNSILGFSQLLSDDPATPLDDSHQRFVQRILDNGEHLLALIDQILDLSKIESGNQEIDLMDVPVNDLIDDCMRTARPLAAPQNIQLTLGSEITPLLSCRADAGRLRQVILNLLSNAIKYNREDGEVTLFVETRSFNKIRISVTDTGFGIHPDQQAHLFTPFNRLGYETSNIQGSGIGLSIAKKLIELMEGSIGMTSEIDTGSTFWVELPGVFPQASAPAVVSR